MSERSEAPESEAMMRWIKVDAAAPDHQELAEAAQALRDGELVAFPTETVYGLGASALDPGAVAKIFEAKGRPATNPLIVHVSTIEQARALTAAWPEQAQRLALAFWPGPLTLVLPRAAHVPRSVTAGLDQVAVRIPAHPVARALLELADVPVAAPSANRYTQVSPTRAEHVARALGDRIKWLVDGGPTSVGLESTVLSLAQLEQGPELLRPGMIDEAALAAIIGPLRVRPHRHIDEEVARPSPGLARKHYAPRARVVLWDDSSVLDERLAVAQAPVVVVALSERLSEQVHPWGWRIELPKEPHAYARELYRVLHRVDELGASEVLIQAPPDGQAWRAVWDRLSRAVT